MPELWIPGGGHARFTLPCFPHFTSNHHRHEIINVGLLASRSGKTLRINAFNVVAVTAHRTGGRQGMFINQLNKIRVVTHIAAKGEVQIRLPDDVKL